MSALVLAPEGGRVRVLSEVDALRWLEGAGRAFAIDTETTGVEWDCEVRLVQFGDDRGGIAVDVSNEDGRKLVRKMLRGTRKTLVFHNASFDIHALTKVGCDPDRLWAVAMDTYVMAHVHNPDGRHGLEYLTQTLLNVDDSEWKAAFKKQMRKRKWTWATVPRLVLTPYGVADTVNTYRLYEHFRRVLSVEEMEVVYQEMEALVAVYEVQDHGLRLDLDYALNLKARWEAEQQVDEAWFGPQLAPYALSDKDIQRMEVGELNPTDLTPGNPNSNAQVAKYLEARGWVPKERTPTGKAKLDKKVLKELAGEYELVDRLLKYKRRGKWLAAYVDNCIEQVDKDGLVHARYNSLGAKTGRMSCSNPPLQQLPSGGGGEVRRLFVASPGNLIASVDYSAIELRLAGALSGEPRIIEAYAEGLDIYQQVADSIGVPRPVAKVVVLASLYGWQGGGAAAPEGYSIAQQRDLIAGFWATYPHLSKWVTATKRRYKDTKSFLWGRNLAPHSPYAAPNAAIQGTAAEVLKEGLLRLGEAGLLRYVAAIVHDEVVLDVPEGRAHQLTDEVVAVLRDDRFAIPLVAEGEVYGRSWGDGYTEKEVPLVPAA